MLEKKLRFGVWTCVIKLAKDKKKGEKNLIDDEDLLDKTISVSGMETKDSGKVFRAF